MSFHGEGAEELRGDVGVDGRALCICCADGDDAKDARAVLVLVCEDARWVEVRVELGIYGGDVDAELRVYKVDLVCGTAGKVDVLHAGGDSVCGIVVARGDGFLEEEGDLWTGELEVWDDGVGDLGGGAGC